MVIYLFIITIAGFIIGNTFAQIKIRNLEKRVVFYKYKISTFASATNIVLKMFAERKKLKKDRETLELIKKSLESSKETLTGGDYELHNLAENIIYHIDGYLEKK